MTFTTVIKTVMAIFLIQVFIGKTMAQTAYQKHPRVIEMERQMTKDALDFLKSRFPDYPVIVTVAIDPLFRVERQNKQATESLPYFRVDDEEIVDEWDDPSLANSFLLNRVKKIVVNVSVPGHLSDDELAEIKQSITLNLNLNPARDTTDINRRSWAKQKDPEFEPLKYIWFAFGFFFFLFLSLLLAIWTPMRQIVKVLREGVSTQNRQSSNQTSAPPVMTLQNWKPPGDSNSDRRDSSKGGGDVRFNDPIKVQSALAMVINQLSRSESFPTLSDMVVLDEVCRNNPPLIGALLMEFPIASRETIFSFSYGNHWMEALIKPGIIDIRMYEVLHRLNRNPRSNEDLDWQKLLVAVWRLYDRRGEFLRDINQEEAFTILYYLPKSLALKTAREMYPGSWAILLDPKFTPKPVAPTRVMDLLIAAVKMVPLRTMSVLERFRQDKDLISFLRTADPNTEREIYTASSKDSILHQMRPPFFKVLEASKEELTELVQSFSLSDWALALANLNHKDRKVIDSAVGKKQRFRLNELIVQVEATVTENETIGQMRERVAEKFTEILELRILQSAQKNLSQDREDLNIDEEEDNEKQTA